MPKSDRPSMESIPPVRCRAKSSRTGEACRNYAIVGGKVCHFHGGAAPQVKEAARRRIESMVPDALQGIAMLAGMPHLDPDTGEVIHIPGSMKDEVRLRALQDILDRAGLKGTEKLEITEQHVDNETLDSLIEAAMQARLGRDAE